MFQINIVKAENSRSQHCTFTFIFRVGAAANHRLVERYSNLRDFHVRLQSLVANQKLPAFPPKSWLFQSATDKKFLEKRKALLLEYFQTLVKDPKLLKMDIFHNLLNLPELLRARMVKIAEDVQSKAYVVGDYLNANTDSNNSSPVSSPTRSLTDEEKEEIQRATA